MEQQMIERLHNAGKMTDIIYYQVNGKTAQENYAEILTKRQKQFKTDADFEKLIAEKVRQSLDDIFSRL